MGAMKRKSPGMNRILMDQWSKFSSLLESGIKLLDKNTGSVMKNISLYEPGACTRAVIISF